MITLDKVNSKVDSHNFKEVSKSPSISTSKYEHRSKGTSRNGTTEREDIED